MPDPNTSHQIFRKSQRGKVIALGFDDQANHRARMDVYCALLYQQAIHGGVKPAVIDNIVDMPVHVVVRPAGADITKNLVGTAGLRLGTC